MVSVRVIVPVVGMVVTVVVAVAVRHARFSGRKVTICVRCRCALRLLREKKGRVTQRRKGFRNGRQAGWRLPG
jgi:hypothetical protein